MEDFMLGFMAGALAAVILIGIIDPYENGAIDATKGEIVCAQLPDERWECWEK